MIPGLVARFEKQRGALRAKLSEKHPESYEALVRALVEVLHDEDSYDVQPDPERITTIDHGHYQGTQLFVIAATGYQPSNYFYTCTYYGSCSGCDTLESIRGYYDEKPTEKNVEDYMTLATHLLQRMKKISVYGETEDE